MYQSASEQGATFPAQNLLSESKCMFLLSTKNHTSALQVSEGPPLRLWRSTIEVPATPEEILKRLLKEQHLWDMDLLDSKVIETLDSQTEVYQYVQNSMAPHPARDYVVLRWEPPNWCDHGIESYTLRLSPCVTQTYSMVMLFKRGYRCQGKYWVISKHIYVYSNRLLHWVELYLLELSSNGEEPFKCMCAMGLDFFPIACRYSG